MACAAWADLFTNRQLTALTTFSDLVREAREQRISRWRRDADYADAVATYLALRQSTRSQTRQSALCTWDANRKDEASNTFRAQAIPMTWDFAEVNPFAMSAGDISGCRRCDAQTSSTDFQPECRGIADQASATAADLVTGYCRRTDPPYYDNVGYADLSDFFYVWLRRSLGEHLPRPPGHNAHTESR